MMRQSRDKWLEEPLLSSSNTNLASINLQEPKAEKIFECEEISQCITIIKKAQAKSRKAAWAARTALLSTLSLTIYLCIDNYFQTMMEADQESKIDEETAKIARDLIAEQFINATYKNINTHVIIPCTTWYPSVYQMMQTSSVEDCCSSTSHAYSPYSCSGTPIDYSYVVTTCDELIEKYCNAQSSFSPPDLVKSVAGVFLSSLTILAELINAISSEFFKFLQPARLLFIQINPKYFMCGELSFIQEMADKYNIKFEKNNFLKILRDFEDLYAKKFAVKTAFLMGSQESKSSVSKLFSNSAFDPNVIPMIFDYLPNEKPVSGLPAKLEKSVEQQTTLSPEQKETKDTSTQTNTESLDSSDSESVARVSINRRNF